TEIGEKRRGVLGVELRDLELDLRADGDGRRARALEERRQSGRLYGALEAGRGLARGEVRLVDVDDDEERLRREKLKAAQALQILGRQVGERSQRTSLLERRRAEGNDVALAFEIDRLRLLQIFLEPFQPTFCDAEIREDELVLHRLRVARRID